MVIFCHGNSEQRAHTFRNTFLIDEKLFSCRASDEKKFSKSRASLLEHRFTRQCEFGFIVENVQSGVFTVIIGNRGTPLPPRRRFDANTMRMPEGYEVNVIDGVGQSEVDARFLCECLYVNSLLFRELQLKMPRDMKRNLICANIMAHIMQWHT